MCELNTSNERVAMIPRSATGCQPSCSARAAAAITGSAVNRKTVRFHQLSGKTGARVAQKRVDPQNDEEVPYENIVKGYELAPDRYVVVEPQELDALQPEKTRAIEIEDFVELDQIDPI